MKKIQDILESLKTGDRRMTILRKSLVSLFASEPSPLSLEEIQAELSRMKVKPHRVSLYRELDFLKVMGVIETVTIDHGKVRYELSGEFGDSAHHHHLICMDCKSISDIEINDGELIMDVARESRRQKFTLVKHSLEFFGICKSCR